MKIKDLKSEVLKYLRLRKVFRILEAIASLIVIIVLLAFGDKLTDIIACIAGIVIIPESFLAVRRSNLKITIRNENMLAKKEIEFYSEIKSEFEKFRDEFISKGSENYVSEECKEIVWKEEMGIGWLSTKIKEFESKCNQSKQIIENLKSIKRLVIF